MTALYIGGAGEDKAALARRLHGPDIPLAEDLHLAVRAALEAGRDPMDLLPGLIGTVTTCDEIGCGVVPLDRSDRDWREAVGRLCCALADQADLVVLVVCGLPQVLKGTLPQA